MFTIDVYNKNTKPNEFFTRNGDATLEKCISCVSKERLNGDYSLEVVYPLNDKKSKHFQKWNIIKADGQLFRIYNTKNDYINDRIEVYARHIFYDLDNYFTIDKRAVKCNVKNALEKCIEENEELKSIYSFSSDIEKENTLYFVEENVSTSIFSIIKRWGVGELIRDNFNVSIRNDVTYSTGYEIRYKKNMIGLKIEENVEDIITKIYPVGYNGLKLPEKFVEVPISTDKEDIPPHDIVKKITFSEAKDIPSLRAEARAYAKSLSMPFKNISCDMLEIYDTNTYKHFTNIKKIKVGDVCKIIHDKRDIDLYMKCSYVERDLINSENNKVELGSMKEIFDKKQDFSDIYSQIESSKPTIYFYQNDNEEVIKNEYKQLFYTPIELASSTHLKLYICLNGISNDNGVLSIEVRLNNSLQLLQPNHTLNVGENVIGLPIAIPALQGGDAYYLSVAIKCTKGTFIISKNNAQIFAECTGASGGTSTEKPHIETNENIKFNETTINKTSNENIEIAITNPTKISAVEEVQINKDFVKLRYEDNVVVELKNVVEDIFVDSGNFEFNEEFFEMQSKGLTYKKEFTRRTSKEVLENGYVYSCEVFNRNDFDEIYSEVFNE